MEKSADKIGGFQLCKRQNEKIFSIFDFLYPWLLFCAE